MNQTLSSGGRSTLFADRYELGALLGRGGMAEVFEGVAHGAHGFARRVAIKRLLPEVGGDDYLVRMFLDEARIASHLHHAGIVAVLDYGVVDNIPFQVLELVEGWDTAKLFRMTQARGGRVPIEIAMLFATEVAHALAYAHERKDEKGSPLGIVHRDVKPSNILVSKSGDVKLGDFGIAFAKERSAVTTKFAARGTPGYMSPEQLFGGPLGPPSDVFAVGLTLYGLLTGESPLKRDGHRILTAGAEIPLSPDLPLDVREIIQRAVRVRPEHRYASARELAQALGEVLAPRMETDPKSLVTEWLAALEAPAPKAPATTTAIMVPAKMPGHFSSHQPPVAPPPTPPPPATRFAHPSPASLTPGATSRTPSLISAHPPPQGLYRAAPSATRTLSAPPARRGGMIFAIAALLPLGLAAGVLIVLFVFRPLVWSPTPKVAETAIAPDAQPASEVTPLPSDTPVPTPASVATADASARARAQSAESPDVVVSSATLDSDAPLGGLAATPAARKSLAASLNAAVTRCAAGKRVRRGTQVHVATLLRVDGSVKETQGSVSCVGSWCRGPGASPWASPEVTQCAATAAASVGFPPLDAAYPYGLQLDLFFGLR